MKETNPLRSQKKDIDDMDFKELRNEVRELSDALLMMQRRFEDILYNIDSDNLSTSLKRVGENMQTQIVQNEEKIELEAEKRTENEEKISALTVTADGIRMSVQAVYSNPVEVENMQSDYPDKSQIYYVKSMNKYAFWDGKLWNYVSQANFGTVFEQTATGFKLKGNVSISGNLITEGDITGINICGSRFYDNKKDGYMYLYASGGSATDFILMRGNETEVFKIYDNISSIQMYGNGKCFLATGYSDRTTPQGTWDFSYAEVKGLETTAVFA